MPRFFVLDIPLRLLDQRVEGESVEFFRLASRFIQLANGRRRPLRSVTEGRCQRCLQQREAEGGGVAARTMRPSRAISCGHSGLEESVLWHPRTRSRCNPKRPLFVGCPSLRLFTELGTTDIQVRRRRGARGRDRPESLGKNRGVSNKQILEME